MNMKKVTLFFYCILTLSMAGLTDTMVFGQNSPAIKSVIIGKQEWSTENFNGTRYRNGDRIPEAKTNEEWKKCAEEKRGCWCFYGDDSGYENVFGRLYNWYAVTDPRVLAPAGWHIPTEDEWTALGTVLGGYKKAAIYLKSKEGWADNGNGNDSTGYHGLPGGYRKYDGSFHNIGSYGYWWSTTEYQDCCAWFRILIAKTTELTKADYKKDYGFSVRFIKD